MDLNNLDDLRIEVERIFLKRNMAMKDLVAETGLTYTSLTKLLRGGYVLRTGSLLKIKNWLKSQENFKDSTQD